MTIGPHEGMSARREALFCKAHSPKGMLQLSQQIEIDWGAPQALLETSFGLTLILPACFKHSKRNARACCYPRVQQVIIAGRCDWRSEIDSRTYSFPSSRPLGSFSWTKTKLLLMPISTLHRNRDRLQRPLPFAYCCLSLPAVADQFLSKKTTPHMPKQDTAARAYCPLGTLRRHDCCLVPRRDSVHSGPRSSRLRLMRFSVLTSLGNVDHNVFWVADVALSSKVMLSTAANTQCLSL